MSKSYFILFFTLYLTGKIVSQCDTDYNKKQSPKIANYDIDVNLDHIAKTAECTQVLRWKNTSPDTIHSLRFYMYMNAFKDLKSSYLRNSGGKVFGRSLKDRTADEWGHISINSMTDRSGNALHHNMTYIQPGDGNKNDQSVIEIRMEEPILPGQIGLYKMSFTTKMPKTIARSGYSQKDFFLFVHWFPQVGVYEQNKEGVWGWNCHQFVPGTEFFADFGDYNVTIHASDHLTIGGSGCRILSKSSDGRQTVKFQAHDLIDFGFVVYSEFDTYTSRYDGVDIEILMPPEHCEFAGRYLEAIEHSIEYLNDNVGRYPYPKITVVDPPVHALNSGFMEYPMMITAASFYGIPKSVRSVESLVVHEFTHMYFMATLASNEKEEAWLDEGFVTYYEDRITDHFHGEKKSLFNILGFKSGNAENSRLEYTKLDHSRLGPIATPGWKIRGPYKGLVYAKTSSMLKTLEGLITRPVMDRLVKAYFEAYKFKHPKEADLRRVAHEVLDGEALNFDLDEFFDQCLHGTESCDFELSGISTQKIGEQYEHRLSVRQNRGLIFPVNVEIVYENGTKELLEWDGKGKEKEFVVTSSYQLTSAYVDPEHKIFLDVNFNNNSLTYEPNTKPVIKYTTKSVHWMQTLLDYASFIF